MGNPILATWPVTTATQIYLNEGKLMTTSTKQAKKYAELDAILDFAYSADARRQASRERNKTIAELAAKFSKKSACAKVGSAQVSKPA